METILATNGVNFTGVNLSSVYIASLALTFQVDLVEGNQSSSISQLNSHVRSLSHFSNYAVIGNTRGSVDVTEAGKTKLINVWW